MQFTRRTRQSARRTRLFGSSTKTLKGDAYGWKTQISYLTPGGDLCPWATPGCRSMCLGVVSGHFQAPKGAARQAQARRSAELKALIHIGGLRAAALAYVADITRPKDGDWSKVAVRVNGTSDLPALAEMVAQEARAAGKPARFYDYTKSLRAALAWANGTSSIHRTFSLSESNWSEAHTALKAGCNVAAVCESESAAAVLAVLLGASLCITGDAHDLRFLDPDQRGGQAGCLIWLTPKGKARHDTTGFVVRQAHLDQTA